jgi:tetratricopeptide (TPR) repeat protein
VGRRCSVCEHPQRALIEAAVASGTGSKRRISARFNVTEQALRRHIGSHGRAGSRFVGRARELAQIDAGLADTSAGKGSLYLVVGEPGIGKSTLLDEIAMRATARAFTVLWGRCWEAGGAPALWPWTQVVRGASQHAESATSALGSLRPTDDDASRFELFSSVVDTLRSAAARGPVVVLLDDVHAADTASLLLLAFAAGEVRDLPVMIVATYRDVEARRSPELARMLAAVARSSKRLPLAGFDASEVARLVEAASGSEQPEVLIRRIHSATGGNPFFVDEVLRAHLATATAEGGGAIRIPQGVRDAIRSTLGPLDDRTRELLESAAVLGRTFDAQILATVCGIDVDEAVAAMRATGVVVDTDGGDLTFSHALVRETVYDDIRPGTRVQLHRRVGETLEARTDADARSSELAFHFFNAAHAGGARKAVDHAKRAGDRAMDVLAYEDAAAEYGRAVQALGLCEPDEARHCDLLVDLGQALTRAGDLTEANRNLRTAADLARRLGDADRFALAVRDMSSEAAFGTTDEPEVALIEEALDTLGAGDNPVRASLLGRLGRLLAPRDPARSSALSAQAIDMARRIGDRNVLATALIYALSSRWGPDDLDERLQTAAEIVGVARGDRDRFLGLCALAVIHLERAERHAADEMLRELVTIAGRLMQPRYTWQARVLQACFALIDGRFREADDLAREALATGERAHEVNVELIYGAHAAVSHNDQGLLLQLEGVLTSVAERYPTVSTWPAVLAVLHAAAGQPERARRELDRVTIDWLPHDGSWLLNIAMASEATSLVRDAGRAGRLYELLLPYTGRIVMVASTAAYGPVDRYLGLLAAARDDREAADRHFRAAYETCRRMHAPTWEAHVLADHGRALLDGDDRRGAQLLAQAADAYRALGLEELAASTSGETDPRGVEPAITTDPVRAELKRDGTAWRVVFEGAELRVRDSHGMRYLSWLLARPGRESHVLDLVSALRGGGEAAVASGDAGEAIDPAARAAYRGRIEELRAELGDAEDRGDAEAVGRAQDEIDAIARELSTSLGLGGRARKAASEAERARLNVTRAIRTAIASIEGLSPSLGRYLQTTVRTGTFCSYTPDPRFPVVWDL